MRGKGPTGQSQPKIREAEELAELAALGQGLLLEIKGKPVEVAQAYAR